MNEISWNLCGINRQIERAALVLRFEAGHVGCSLYGIDCAGLGKRFACCLGGGREIVHRQLPVCHPK